jgi:adenylate kinase family enzyme
MWLAMPEHLKRVMVVGPSCCGKTTFSRQLAEALASPRIELDPLLWGPNWARRPDAEFRGLTQHATSQAQWVVDGDYLEVASLLWPRATAIVWLNYRFLTVFLRAFRRTIRRALLREELYNCNRESFVDQFLFRDSILVWVVTKYGRTRKNLERVKRDGQFPQLRWFEFRRPRDAETFLKALQSAG